MTLDPELDRLRGVFDAINSLVVMYGPDGRLVYFNPTSEKTSGYRSDEIVGADNCDFLHPAHEVESARTVVKAALAGQPVAAFENHWLTRTRELRSITWSASNVYNADGTLKYLIATGTDMTEEKRKDRELKQTNARMELALESANMGAWHVNLARNQASLMGSTEALLGVEPGTFKGTIEAFSELLLPADLGRVTEAVKESLEKGKPYREEFRILKSNGNIIWCLSRGLVLRNQAGKPVEMTGIILDITELKLVEQERMRALEATQQALQLREDFISIASHELKTPITPLKVGLSILKRAFLGRSPRQLTQNQLKKMFEISDNQLNRLIQLVDSLLDVSRIRLGKMTLHRQRVDLAEAVREAVQQLERESSDAHTTVELRMETGITGDWDCIRISQIITNLLTNALKYGSGQIVTVATFRKGDFAVLEVQDRGIGIAAEAQQRIFRRFERAVSASSFSGLGLGLYITQQIVEAHGGTIEVESAPGKGSLFRVQLPVIQS